MTTSLQEQLRRLAVPQTMALADARTKASILFDRKEAGTKSRRTIFDIGLTGLQELAAINPIFLPFQSTLFDESAIDLERSVEQSDVNKLLDRNINKFLRQLSPYFMLRSSLMCLEWLVRRFHIQEYNRNALLALALPYHETNAFVMVLQIIRIKQDNQEWGWLRPLQKPGLPVPKSAIINRAATDAAFLKFVCQSTLDAIKELGTRADSLQVLLNFYAHIVVGALENANEVSEWHIITILPSLLKGLQSEVLDFAAAAYIIATQLVARTQVTSKLCNALVERTATVSLERLRSTAVLFLVFLFDSQTANKPKFSETTLVHVASQKWFTSTLAALAKDKVYVHSVVVPLLHEAVTAIQNGHAKTELLKQFVERLLEEVDFHENSAQEVINAFLNAYTEPATVLKQNKKLDDGDTIELSSDEEMEDEGSNFKAWYSDFLRKFERKYPDAFDVTIKQGLSAESDESSSRRSVLKMALGYRLKSCDASTTDIYENLYHHTAKIRALAVQVLLENLNNYRERSQNQQLLQECLADRISDESELVVAEVLKLPTKTFAEVLGYNGLAKALFGILHKIQQDQEHWAQLTSAVVQHLTSQQMVANYDTNIILLAFMPQLFPEDTSQIAQDAIHDILKSALVEKFGFLKELKLSNCMKSDEFSDTKFKKQFLKVISTSKETPAALELFKSVESYGEGLFTHSLHFAHFLLLATACLRENLTGAEGGYIFAHIYSHYKQFKVRQLQWSLVKKTDCIPLQLFCDFIIALTRHTNFEHLHNWEQPSANLKTFLCIFDLLANAGFTQENVREQQEWLKTLKQVCDNVFENAQSKFSFLTNFYVYENLTIVEEYAVLRIRAFKIMNSLLKNKTNKLNFTTEHIFRISTALNSQSEVMRLQALETITILNDFGELNEYQSYFINHILERNYEIGMDNEQFALILYTILKPPTQKKHKQSIAASKILNEIVQMIAAPDALENPAFMAEALKTLKHINDEKMLGELIPIAANTFAKATQCNGLMLLQNPYSTIFRLICDRFESEIIENVLVDRPKAWQFVEKIFNSHAVFIPLEDKLQSVVCVFLEAIDEYGYEKMPQKYKVALIKLIIKTVAEADNDSVSLTANKLLKKCVLQATSLVNILEQMYETTLEAKTTKRKSTSSAGKHDTAVTKAQIQVNSPTWKQGMVLLEFLESKKKLGDSVTLIPALFKLLQFCLEVEEHTLVEYTKQLSLSMILHCCQLSRSDGVDLMKALPKATFRIDLIVQCVRGTQNPQTQHNALLLLSHCAALFPQQVLHNIVDVFTFMGSSVVRQDDAFSFHILNKVIESIIPILVRGDDRTRPTASASAESANEHVIPVLKVFSDILLDVPEHRRLPLYSKLLLTLGAEQYLWILLCIVFEAHVLDDEKQRLQQKKSKTSIVPPSIHVGDKFSKRIEICLELAHTFEPQVTLETCIQLLGYIKSLPLNKEATSSANTASSNYKKNTYAVEATEVTLFDVKCRSAKQLRHYKYIIMQFLSTISNSTEFLHKIALLSDEDQLVIKPYYQNFIIKTLSYVPIVNAAIEKAEDSSQSKFWKVILHHLHDVLDNAISLLSPDMFLVVVHGLMQHQLLGIRKKVIELLISKLQQRDGYFDGCESENFYSLLKPLSEIACSILQQATPSDAGAASSSVANEQVFLQQTSLIAIKLLSKMFALQRIDEFRELLAHLIKILKCRAKVSKILLATVVLTIVEISSNLKAHSLALLPKYMPQMIEILQDQSELVRQQPPDNICVAIITGTQKLFESLPLFLGPYVVDVITALSTISTHITAQRNEKDHRSSAALHRISLIWSRIASDVPVRILVPSCEKSYTKLMAAHNYADIGVLMKLLPECIGKTASSDLVAVQSELSAFFMRTLQFRLQVQRDCTPECVTGTEATIIDAFVAWVLKLSESSFRPIYHKVYEWAIKQTAQRETILTFFVLTNKIAGALKSLFVLFARDFVDDIANLLDEYNSTKQTIELNDEVIAVDIIKAMLGTLHNLFLYDSKGFINSQRFEALMPPLIDQLENRLVLEHEELQQGLSMCIAQLAVTVSSDIMWKQLNYQVLMKTRTNVPEVRILSFNCCLEIARKLGEDFTPLLPETVPFVAELLEDENQRVEKSTRKAVQELESILGESLQNYL